MGIRQPLRHLVKTANKHLSMARQKVPFAEMRKHLVEQTAKVVGGNVRFVEAGLEIRPRGGTPNWDANISIAPKAVIRAFVEAVRNMQKEYDVSWTTEQSAKAR
jgi:hypothetical protein